MDKNFIKSITLAILFAGCFISGIYSMATSNLDKSVFEDFRVIIGPILVLIALVLLIINFFYISENEEGITFAIISSSFITAFIILLNNQPTKILTIQGISNWQILISSQVTAFATGAIFFFLSIKSIFKKDKSEEEDIQPEIQQPIST
jgi:hypothetical protein